MGIDLYEHNGEAYKSAISMLDNCKKAAIVHPTGTGKSFIGFKLCEDNANKCICWLSPSEYIFKTQIENVKKVEPNFNTDNIVFITYAKLMLMSESEIDDICPDYIILDEFHRCGAAEWGKGVERLLDMYNDIPILGLSATAIRYLDNQRNMADELFDGNVASEMTLGEAIVRGILNPPKYVLSVFSYQKELEKYQKRLSKTKNKLVRDEGSKYLDALRRALEKADGMPEIFNKHITDKTGKYIVFCSNFEHMHEMVDLSFDWFSDIDKAPHIYTAYSKDTETSTAFNDFKADNSNHLKLLYCIDMLNEGIHVDDISGVILLRPTVSPIIYKQQIGRALSANSRNNAVIFDIVLNIENLYSIGEIEEEMQIATSYYRSLGETDMIINEHFRVIDEVHDCLELFDKLENTLTASWDLMFDCAKKYYLENGNLEVPARYITDDGYSLGSWICNQRSIRKKQMTGVLTEEQIQKLDSIGMRWDYYTDYTWDVNFTAAQNYYKKYGNLDVSSRYVDENGLNLGAWLSNLRTWESAGVHCKYLTEERKKQLEEIGMIWSKLNFFWENNYSAAVEFYRVNGHLIVPTTYVSPNGVRLGSWIHRVRNLYHGRGKGTPPTPEQIDRLNNIGMDWTFNLNRKWETAYEYAKDYYETNGNLDVVTSYKTASGFTLGQWLNNQRKAHKKGDLDISKERLLNQIGMIWELVGQWEKRYYIVKKFFDETGNINISQQMVVDGVWIGKWLVMQKKLYDANEKLSAKQRKLLEHFPLEQIGQKDRAWFEVYADAELYFNKHKDLNVPASFRGKSGVLLSDWIIRQRSAKKNGKLSEDKVQLLDKIGFVWVLESVWDEGYRHAKEYYETNGNLDMQKAYKCDDGYSLGFWIYNYRNAYNKTSDIVSIDDEQIKLLEAIGMNWKPDKAWDKRFAEMKEFIKINGDFPKKDSSDKSEYSLANWLYNQRNQYRLGYVREYKLKRLAEIGINEEWLSFQPTPFEKGLAVARDYYKQYGNLDFATNYQHENGFWLGSWAMKIREKKETLSDKQIKALDDMGFVWKKTDPFEEKFAIAKAFYEENGYLPLEPKQCKDKKEVHINQWLRRQYVKRQEGKLSQECIDRLSSIGMDWLTTNERAWNRGYSKAEEYYKSNGNLNVIVSYVCDDGYPLGEWLHSQRTHRKRLSAEKIQSLMMLEMKGIS